MAQLKRFFECLLPVTVCNLRCPYCYIIQENRRKMEIPPLQYTPEQIAYALRPERVGGTCWISICGAGETLIQPECIDIVSLLLEKGHFINITTNGTQTKKFEQLIEKCGENIKHLHLSFSLHYTELVRLHLLDCFFDNVDRMKHAGASILVQFNLCDEYLPHLDEIKRICLERIGALPQVALTRDESTRPMKIHSKLTDEQYYEYGKQFNSPLFDFTYANFNKERTEFCYAGDWSGTLNLQTGILRKCYANYDGAQNIFENPEEDIDFEAVGRNCRHLYCINSSHFMSLGVIPTVTTPSYGALRNRPTAAWYTPEMESFLNTRLYDNNRLYTLAQKMRLGWKYGDTLVSKIKTAVKYALPENVLSAISKLRKRN